jgi:steroid delta-isomerase-like uncharacterized protein
MSIETKTNREVMESYVAAWRERDPQKIAAHFADEGVRRWEIVVPIPIGGPNRFQGREEIAEPMRSLLTAIPDLELEVRQLVGTDEGGLLEWVHSGTHTGAWNKLAPQGEHVEFSGVAVYTISEGKITEERLYFDPNLLVRDWAIPLDTLMGVGMTMWKQGRATKKARRVADRS